MRNRKKILVGLACLSAGSLLLTDTAHADRRTGLGGNLLIQDPDDLFPFPQYALQHRNMIRLDYGSTESGNSGNGVMTLGNETHAYGVALHRGDLLSPDVVGFNTELGYLGGVGNPFNTVAQGAFAAPALPVAGTDAGTVSPATVADLSYARTLGRDVWGLRLGFGRGIQASKVDGDVTKGSSTFIAAQFGYSILPPQGLRMDLSANIVGAFGKSTVAGDNAEKAFDLRVGALGRGYYPINDLVDIGFLAHLSVDNERYKTYGAGPGNVKANDFGLDVMAGAGPAIHLDGAQIAAYGGFVLGAGKQKPDSDADGVSRLNWAAPMVNMAVEVQLLDWLFVRTAAQYTWQLDRFKAGDGDTAVKDRVSSAPFSWSFGLGAVKNNFYFDGVIRNSFVTNGPAFVGGGTPGFLAMASATYKFGDVFGKSSTRATPAATSTPVVREPAPVVEPQAAPAYDIAPSQENGGAPAPSPVEGNANVNATGTSTTAPGGSVNTQGSVGGGVSIGR